MLQRHESLYKDLIKIPEKRKMIIKTESEGDKLFGLPRFEPNCYDWSPVLLTQLRNHLQDIWVFFEKYSYYFDSTLLPILSYKTRRVSKKSIIFLMERDVWETDEVYGKYLIEIKKDSTHIGYFRFERVIKKYTIETHDLDQIESWICNDAINQIQNQFSYLWNNLKKEIRIVMKEKYTKPPKKNVDSPYLKKQFHKILGIVDVWPESALLNLGRIMELWLRISLSEQATGCRDLINLAKVRGIIDKNGARLMDKIRRNNNDLKHKPYYQVKAKKIKHIVKQFKDLIHS
ncbi:MAG: hypothetical protein GF311_07620 [Candidatus Lokiarchaeota archaeon]|nr:hypothetical protein [Candidatus Lokiarchaeota archaeon]